ncbi:hypothetical protein [Nocardia sp. alder85J]|uniref:hypothetical protein n=1 Tax=Nocardia sp. alder85J TaxID=2862949 RepID=UPI001CD5051E|nr:hypothetical protein [Nocardia sp. alder85J]MCX4095924.1 hypothetical protein [Nocardia sp. alder85J]
MSTSRTVATVAALLDAVDRRFEVIEVLGTICGVPRITLAPGVMLTGGALCFGGKGVRLTCDNVLDDISVVTPVDEVAIYNDLEVEDFGTLWLRQVHTIGQVSFTVGGRVRTGHLCIEGLHVDEADVRGRSDRPSGYGVETIQGAFTLWNRSADPEVVVTADLTDIGAGTAEHPIRGCGVLVCGVPGGGTLGVKRLRTGEIHADGHIPPATTDLIGGGVLVLSGAQIGQVVAAGPVTTYGHNDLAFDNWGEVAQWTVQGPAVSKGTGGSGFRNRGAITRLEFRAPLETFGHRANGFDLESGSVGEARFTTIVTHGDGAVGARIGCRLRRLEITGTLCTHGGEAFAGNYREPLPPKAFALRVDPGSVVEAVLIGGGIHTCGDGLASLHVDGTIGGLRVGGEIRATGRGSDAVRSEAHIPGLEEITLVARDGAGLVLQRETRADAADPAGTVVPAAEPVATRGGDGLGGGRRGRTPYTPTSTDTGTGTEDPSLRQPV